MASSDYEALTPDLGRYALIAVSAGAPAVLQGFFVLREGKQVGSAVALTITSAAPKSFVDVGGGSIPNGAVGFVGTLTGGSLWWGLGANADGTIPGGQTPGSGYPKLDPSNFVAFGRVSG